ncbi:heme exporter protein CcmD [Salinimonas sediminis]|uniref:Heme exporter protein D n=1 Tax=Salinimonas sediminis TaxID=2303538 RepID=A0A346NJC4_9ALTE|nr:heme exporter protein CcmD [Salinimonas sediminis]AXR05631.1 heme exporter protein CcmD [Salinimonas sediminis]
MNFDSFAEFIAMGGYGLYVWLSFGVSFSVMLLLVIAGWYERKILDKEIRQEAYRQQRIQVARTQAAQRKDTV